MLIKTPKFFYSSFSFISFFLKPLGFLFYFITTLRRSTHKPYKSKISVICCGNITLGGTGKTPFSIWLGKSLKKQGKKIAYLTRGWQGQEKGPLLVNLKTHTANQVGDEPLLLAQEAPTIVSQDRQKGIMFAKDLGIDVLIMDDGFQNPYIYKDFSCLIFDGYNGLGNNNLFPAGPLRETLKSGIKLSQCAVIIGQDRTELKKKIHNINPLFPVFNANLCPIIENLKKETRYLAFAGIGFPEKFFNTLKKYYFNLVEHKSFPDHYMYTEKDLQKIQTTALALNASLITTEKDFVRLPKKYQQKTYVLPVKLQLEKQDSFLELLLSSST